MNKQSPSDFIHIGTGGVEEEDLLVHKDFDRMEERIQMVEELVESWKDAIMAPKNQINKEFMVRAFAELAELTNLVDHLYAEWIQMDEEHEDAKEPRRVKDQIVC